MKTAINKHPYNCPAYDISSDFDFDLKLSKTDYLIVFFYVLLILPFSLIGKGVKKIPASLQKNNQSSKKSARSHEAKAHWYSFVTKYF